MPTDTETRRTENARNLAAASERYPLQWSTMLDEWNHSAAGNHAWMTYAANYLLSSSGYKWAVDPYVLSSRVAGLPDPDFAADLAQLSLIVLTHKHKDHLDLKLIKALQHTNVQWVIPENVFERLRELDIVPEGMITTPVPGQALRFGPIRLLPFDSLHLHGVHGVPETGYLLECGGCRWLFPGDIRAHDFDRLPDFGRLNGVFAHLWMGKARALDEEPPFFHAFCQFFTSFDTHRLVITHLNEFGRDETELWTEGHYEIAKCEIERLNPGLAVTKAMMGDRVDLD